MTTLHSLQNLRKSQTGSAGEALVGSAGGTASNKKTSTKSTKEVTEVRVPRYDKALRNGRGDRLPRDQWALVTGTSLHCVYYFRGIGFRCISRPNLRFPHFLLCLL